MLPSLVTPQLISGVQEFLRTAFASSSTGFRREDGRSAIDDFVDDPDVRFKRCRPDVNGLFLHFSFVILRLNSLATALSWNLTKTRLLVGAAESSTPTTPNPKSCCKGLTTTAHFFSNRSESKTTKSSDAMFHIAYLRINV